MRVICFALALALSACVNSNSGSTLSGSFDDNASNPLKPSSMIPENETSAEAAKVLMLTNEYRARNNLGPLTWNPKLALAAQRYAEQMANEGFFSHTSSAGVTVGQRITSAGYDWWTYGENIAYGYSTPEKVMEGWINSSGHRANLLAQSYQDLGVGYAEGGTGVAYWVQDFGAR